jgi:putative membrane-bound dehydrogenase-like protein
MEAVAVEPDIVAPVAISFDEQGRLFVAEIPDLEKRAAEGPAGRIRVLEDRDGDGKYERNSILASGLAWPSALACYDGGVFVAVTPDIIYLKDTSGAGRADMRRVVFSGFGNTNANAQQLLNSFKWGPDNRIHGATAGLRGLVTSSASLQAVSVAIGDSDFSFDPRTLNLRPEPGPSFSGLSFDSFGRKYTSDFDRPLRMPAYEPRYCIRNPFNPRPPRFVEVVSPSTAVWQFVQGSPTRRIGAAGTPPTDLIPAWIRSARGMVLYQGYAFPTNYYENAFIPDTQARVIHRAVLRPQGLWSSAERSPGEVATEFLVAEDPDFQPWQVVTGPDDALYLADFHGGGESGRIYRIAPTNHVRPKLMTLAQFGPAELVAALSSLSEWRRDSARRLLYERRDPATVPLLTNLLYTARDARARLQALQTLESVDALQLRHVTRALADGDEAVRVRGLVLIERFMRQSPLPPDAVALLRKLTADPSVRVRYQLAFTMGEGAGPAAAPFLLEILGRDVNNPPVRSAALSSVSLCSTELLGLAVGSPAFRTAPLGGELIEELTTMIGTSGRLEYVTSAITTGVGLLPDSYASFTLLSALSDGLRRTRSSLALADTQGIGRPAETLAFNLAIDETTLWPVRTQAVRMLGCGAFTYPDVADWVLALLANSDSEPMELACVATLAAIADPRAPVDLVQRWPSMMPSSRAAAVQVLTRRVDRAAVLLDSLQAGRVFRADISEPQANFLRTHHDPTVQQRALALLGPVSVRRPEVVAQYRQATNLVGVPARGREIFLARCASCHRLGGAGQLVGPELAGVKARGVEKLLSSILEPNAEIVPGYAVSVVHTKEGESYFGVMTDDNGAAVTLRFPGGRYGFWPVSNVQAVESRDWSLMPVGLEAGLNPQGMADLLSYVLSVVR